MYVSNVYTPAKLAALPPTSCKSAQYRRAVARRLFKADPAITEILFVRRGRAGRAPVPEATQVVYVMSTGGRWGRSVDVRRGSALR